MTPALHRAMTPVEWAMLLFMSMLFGGSFFFTAIAIREVPPLTIALTRLVIAAPILLIVLRASGGRPPPVRLWGAFAVMGLINSALPITLVAWGQLRIDSGLAAILAATNPLFGVAVAHFFTADERMQGKRLAGVLVGLAGIVVMIGPSALGSLGDNTLAQLAVLGAAFSGAVASVFGRRFADAGVTPLASAASQVTASTIMLAPLVLLVDRPWTLGLPSLTVILALATMAVFSTALAYLLFFRVLATAGATNIQLMGFLVPVTAIMLGSLVLHEQLDLNHFAGMALIAVGLAVMDGRVWRWVRWWG